jgi:hypothetical protein
MKWALWLLLVLCGPALAQFGLPANFPDPCKLLTDAEVSAAMGAKLHSMAPANQGTQATIGLPVPMCLWSGERLEVVLYLNPLSPGNVPRIGQNPTPLKDPALGKGAYSTVEGKDKVWVYAQSFYLEVQNAGKAPFEIARALALKVALRLPK